MAHISSVLLISHPRTPWATQRARTVADALGASLSEREWHDLPWEPRSPLEGPWDLLVAAPGPATGWPPWRLHSRARHLLGDSEASVLLLHPVAPARAGSLLAVATAAPGGTPGPLLRTAAGLARGLGTELAVVRPWSLVGESILASPLRGVSQERYRSILHEAQSEQEGWLARTLASEIPGASPRTLVRKGPPERVVREAAWELPAGLVVLGNSQPPGLRETVLGSLAERLFRSVPVSVLIHRAAIDQGARSGLPPIRAYPNRSSTA